jgi:repressor LexA
MTNLTKKQEAVCRFIESEASAGRPCPTHREIAKHFGYSGPLPARKHLKALIKKGFLVAEDGKARSLRVVSPLAKLRSGIVDIPMFGSIPAGLPQAREQDAEGCVSVDVNSVGYKPTRNAFALRVKGDSMVGRHIVDGDLVILEHGPDPRHGDVVAALIDGECTLKTYVVRNGKPYLKAENPKYPDLMPAQELVIQGVLKALIRKMTT